jgi:ketosteroid isomerase-like protein
MVGSDLSEDLVELTRGSMELANERDFDAMAATFAADAVFDVSSAGLGRFCGRAEIQRYLEDWIGSYGQQRFSGWEGEDVGNGVVLVVAQLDARPRGTRASVRERWAFAVRWRDGLISRVVATQNVAHARDRAESLARLLP